MLDPLSWLYLKEKYSLWRVHNCVVCIMANLRVSHEKKKKLDLSVHFQHKFSFSTRFKGNTPTSFLGSSIQVAHVNAENQEMNVTKPPKSSTEACLLCCYLPVLYNQVLPVSDFPMQCPLQVYPRHPLAPSCHCKGSCPLVTANTWCPGRDKPHELGE